MQNHNSKFKNFTFYIVTLIFALSTLNLAAAADLKGSIDRKTQELLEITDKINENQKILDAAQGQSRTLKGEIKKINSKKEHTIGCQNLCHLMNSSSVCCRHGTSSTICLLVTMVVSLTHIDRTLLASSTRVALPAWYQGLESRVVLGPLVVVCWL